MDPSPDQAAKYGGTENVRPKTERGRLAQLASDRALTLFFILAYLLSWLVFLPMVLLEGPIQLVILASFGPSLAATITHRLGTGSFRAFHFYTTASRTLLVTALGSILIVVSYVVLPGVTTGDPSKLNWRILASLSLYNYSTFLGGPLGEEPGWRGYALPRLEAHLGPLWGSMLLGILWAGWHLPLFLIPGCISSPLWVYVLITIGLSIILAVATNLARFAVIPAIVMHAVFNTASKFLNGLFIEVQPSAPVRFELVLGLCGLGVGLVLALVTRGRLVYRRHLEPL